MHCTLGGGGGEGSENAVIIGDEVRSLLLLLMHKYVLKFKMLMINDQMNR